MAAKMTLYGDRKHVIDPTLVHGDTATCAYCKRIGVKIVTRLNEGRRDGGRSSDGRKVLERHHWPVPTPVIGWVECSGGSGRTPGERPPTDAEAAKAWAAWTGGGS